jgi:hypothetical protein
LAERGAGSGIKGFNFFHSAALTSLLAIGPQRFLHRGR